jgi:hypothetical protein
MDRGHGVEQGGTLTDIGRAIWLFHNRGRCGCIAFRWRGALQNLNGLSARHSTPAAMLQCRRSVEVYQFLT